MAKSNKVDSDCMDWQVDAHGSWCTRPSCFHGGGVLSKVVVRFALTILSCICHGTSIVHGIGSTWILHVLTMRHQVVKQVHKSIKRSYSGWYEQSCSPFRAEHFDLYISWDFDRSWHRVNMDLHDRTKWQQVVHHESAWFPHIQASVMQPKLFPALSSAFWAVDRPVSTTFMISSSPGGHHVHVHGKVCQHQSTRFRRIQTQVQQRKLFSSLRST